MPVIHVIAVYNGEVSRSFGIKALEDDRDLEVFRHGFESGAAEFAGHGATVITHDELASSGLDDYEQAVAERLFREAEVGEG